MATSLEEVIVNAQLVTAKYVLPDFLGISGERLAGLGGGSLEMLHQGGYLHLAMLAATSLGNVSWLIELKKRKRTLQQA